MPQAYFEVVGTATVASGQFQMRHAPQERIVRREVAQAVVEAAQDFEGALGVRVEDKRQGLPKLHDLPSLQKMCSSRFGWPASKTLEVAQELYDGQGKKIITYPRAEVRYLPEGLISDVSKIVAGLQAGKSFSAIPVPDPPIIRKGASGSFHDKGLEGASHHAVIPNVNTVDNLREVWPRLSIDERKLFDPAPRLLAGSRNRPSSLPRGRSADPFGFLQSLPQHLVVNEAPGVLHRLDQGSFIVSRRKVSDVTAKVGEPVVMRATLRIRDGYRILRGYNNRVIELSSFDDGVAFERKTVPATLDEDALVFAVPLRATKRGRHPINGVFRVGYIHGTDEMAMVSVRLIANVTGTE